ncbi:glycoside hydrolase family 97 protein [Erythrobacter sp. 3-20A1M]|uniref:glycoside hydrolase family 97 protein n=1 Tax=Erythrobacter sp. 3-20A1M TaxID=2653850 RepID=UPI001BFCCABF|nr:glycoside hydrolase family 97 protein [Erythrobacter sp. 3-20A1M]QWC56497.1 glycoside hydrolase family 97 protein [Erythrobacter sp. 3-20A1M]
MRWFALIAPVMMLPSAALAGEVASPDGHIVVKLDVDDEGKPFYSVTKDGAQLFAPSHLGFNLTDEDPLRRDFAIAGETTDSADTRWEQPWGERQWVVDHHNELATTFRQKTGAHREFNVRMRVFDDGVGFRYELPARADKPEVRIAEELTEFDLAPQATEGGTAWWIQAGDWNRYEYLYHQTPIDAVAMAHTPITFRLKDGTHMSIHEAALVDYSGMWLQRMDGGRFRAVLAPSSRGAKVVRKGAFTTPWRTIRIASDAAGLVENDLELNLNEPNKLGDVSWFKPAKYIGIWWGMISGKWTWAQGPDHGATTERTKQYIDFAAKNGFRGVLVEGWDYGWDGQWFGNGRDFSFTKPYPDFDLDYLAKYAKSKGVHLIGHNETGGNIANYEMQLADAMKQNGQLGIDVVKTGYVADAGSIISCNADIADPCEGQVMEWHDGQRQSQHMLRVVEEAAKNHVAIDTHEPIKDTGLRRTYPNWVAREGARGQEYNAWAPFNNPPEHEPTLVYTRMLSGPMDYTPGVLSLEGGNGVPMSSTLAKQLGLYLAIYSPIQMAADFVENLADHPRELEFIKAVPADWAESHLIAGEIGDYAIFARKDRNSADWYAGGINDATARDVTLDFGFLDPGKTYHATVWKDGEGATYQTEARHRIAYDSFTVKAGDKRSFWLAPGGGLAIRIQPVK